LAIILAACAPDEDRAAREAVRAHLARVAPVPDDIMDVLVRTPESSIVRVRSFGKAPFLYYYVVHGTVAFELREDFEKRAKSPEFENELLTRMARRIAEESKRDVEVKPGLPKIISFADPEPIARVETSFAQGAYVETHRFRDGRWVYDSSSLFSRVK
jgi:hypothetical protein